LSLVQRSRGNQTQPVHLEGRALLSREPPREPPQATTCTKRDKMNPCWTREKRALLPRQSAGRGNLFAICTFLQTVIGRTPTGVPRGATGPSRQTSPAARCARSAERLGRRGGARGVVG
jgi:hypothetical protein